MTVQFKKETIMRFKTEDDLVILRDGKLITYTRETDSEHDHVIVSCAMQGQSSTRHDGYEVAQLTYNVDLGIVTCIRIALPSKNSNNDWPDLYDTLYSSYDGSGLEIQPFLTSDMVEFTINYGTWPFEEFNDVIDTLVKTQINTTVANVDNFVRVVGNSISKSATPISFTDLKKIIGTNVNDFDEVEKCFMNAFKEQQAVDTYCGLLSVWDDNYDHTIIIEHNLNGELTLRSLESMEVMSASTMATNHGTTTEIVED